MPYTSKSQQRWAHTKAGTKALGGKSKVAEWDSSTDFSDLPNKKTAGHMMDSIKSKKGKK
jgi:hypothetical protein